MVVAVAKRPANWKASESSPSGIHPHVDDERRPIPEGVEEGIEIGDVQLARIPGGDADVGDAVDDRRHRGARVVAFARASIRRHTSTFQLMKSVGT